MDFQETHIVELLESRGISVSCETVYMMRHADKSYPDMFKYIGTSALTLYQAMQQKEYEPGDYILGFFGNRGKYGLLLGLWRVTHRMGVHEALEKGYLEDSFEHKEHLAPYYYSGPRKLDQWLR